MMMIIIIISYGGVVSTIDKNCIWTAHALGARMHD